MRIPIVNEQDEIIGYKERKDRNKDEITRVTALWITDKDRNVLLAQRAFTKDYSPGRWGPAVAGTVEEGETYESNIIKEAEEELGLKNVKPLFSHKVLKDSSHKFFGQWFILVIDRDTMIKIQEDEVEQVKWFSRGEIIKLYSQNPDLFVASFVDEMKYFLNYEN